VIDLTPVVRFGLLLVRPGMVVMVAPAFAGVHAPPQVKIGLIVLIALGLLPSVPVPTSSEVGLAVIVAREIAIGLSLAFVTRALIAAAEFAGHLGGFQIGFSYGATVDPLSGVRHTMLATLYGLLALMAFLGVNGHHLLLRALADSYAGLPIGGGEVHASLAQSVKNILGLVFTVAVRLAAPIVAVLMVVEVGIGLISRTAPALSSVVIGHPLRIIVGLAVLATTILAVMSVTGSLVPRVVRMAVEMAGAFK
jgi:flagellar biosynthetic protein FliR